MSSENPTDRPSTVHDGASAVAFIKWCIATIGLGYHPDTSFDQYVLADGARCFTDEETATLNALQSDAFNWCDPYEVGLQEFMSITRMKGPIEYQSREFQELLVEVGSREQIIAWLQWNDPNGVYADRDSEIEEMACLTLEKAREIMRDQVSR